MKRIVLIGCTILLLTGCDRKEEAEESQNHAESPSRVSQGKNGETLIALDEAAQKEIGLKVEPVAPLQLSPELKGYGQIVDPAALASAVGDFVTARAANETSQAELKRLKTLTAQNNASERALQAAEAAAARDGAQFESARSKLLANWGTAVVEHTNLPAFIQSLALLESALVRIDLPAGEAPRSPPQSARLMALSGEQVVAGFVGMAPAVDPRTQSQGFLFLVQTNVSAFAPGAAVTGYLQISGEPRNGFMIPRSSIIRHAGATWVYLQTNGTNFVRHGIELDRPLEQGWFITNGVNPGDQVVVTGAQTVFSEELKASGFASEERD
jgi:hypothetical protein